MGTGRLRKNCFICGSRKIYHRKRAAYGFGANDDEHGNAWILLEPSGGQLSALKNKIITLQLREGISIREAEQLAQTLNEMVEAIACTGITRR